MRLKVEFFRYETLVFGKILEQDESLRGMEIIARNEKFCIASVHCPDIRNEKLYIRGANEYTDEKIVTYNFDTVEEAKEWWANIKTMIDEINQEDPAPESKVERLI